MAPPAGGDEHLDPGHPERRPLRRAGKQPRHASVWARSDVTGCHHAGHRVESRQEREGQREGQGEALQSVQQEEAVKGTSFGETDSSLASAATEHNWNLLQILAAFSFTKVFPESTPVPTGELASR